MQNPELPKLIHTLKLDFVLDNKRVILVADGRGELGRDGVVGGLVLEHETLVASHAAKHAGLLDLPCANVCPLLLGVLLLGVRCLPAALPVVCELLEERSFECGGLLRSVAVGASVRSFRAIAYSKGREVDSRAGDRLDSRHHRAGSFSSCVLDVLDDIGS